MAWRVPPRLAAGLLYALYRPWCASLRLQGRAPLDALLDSGRAFVFSLWHNECFTLIYLKGKHKLVTVASQSRDGAYITGVLEHLGFAVARGSSSRGGAGALIACLRHMRQGLGTAVTIDGPRGPRHQVKDGALFLAHAAKAPIVPVRAFPENCLRFKSWDRFELPLPFSRVRIAVGEPYTIDRETLDEAALAEERSKLTRIMNDLEQA